MDGAGVEMQVLSAAPQMPYTDDRDKAVPTARFVNDRSTGTRQAPSRSLPGFRRDTDAAR